MRRRNPIRIRLGVLATLAGLWMLCGLVSCNAHFWHNDEGHLRITSDPPESYPEEGGTEGQEW